MTPPDLNDRQCDSPGALWVLAEVLMLVMLFFIYAGDPAPMVNEAHYLVKAKNFWQPEWCQNDLFTTSAKAHTTFYIALGWLTQFVSLSATAWIGRFVGWLLIAIGLQRLSMAVIGRRLASVAVALVWIAGIEYGNLAGEWVIGGIEAKVPAYGFVLMGLAEMAHRRWNRVWLLLGIASAFHVLSGGWAVLAAMFVWWMTERRRDDRIAFFSKALFVGGAISLLGLLPAVWLTLGVSPKESLIGAKIYTYQRISHHLLPSNFMMQWYIRHGVLVIGMLAGFIFAKPRSRAAFNIVQWFAIGCASIAVCGLMIGALPAVAPDLSAKLLRYYWFRLTDAIVPLAFGITVAQLLLEHTNARRLVGLGCLIIATGLVMASAYQRASLAVPPSASHRLLGYDVGASVEQQRQTFQDWIAVCQWARHATPEDELFLTPRHQQTFKWYAHRAEVVNWKDVPQDASSLITWKRRFDKVFPSRNYGRSRTPIRYDMLRSYRDEYGVRFMIVDQRIRRGAALPLVKVYPIGKEANATYAVYELPYD